MQRALIDHDGISWADGLNVETLDEHSVDAVAVAYWLYQMQFNTYLKRS